jgi:threonine dehydrogenase-like Zn-dependent dehydrogenase
MIAVHLENGRVEVRRTPRPRRKVGHALIRVLAAGICNTDLELQRGYYGFRGRPGHEFAGEVVEAEDATLIGKRIAGEINLACGRCDWCARGLERHCPRRTVLGIVRHPGAFAEFLTLPEGNLHVLPDRLPTERGVFVEPVAAACEILDQVKIPRGEDVAVLGDGKLGLLIAQVLTAHGARVHQFGRHREKLRIAESAGVATEIAGKRLPAAAFDLVVDATGSPDGLRTAVGMARPRGTVIMKSTVHGTVDVDTAPVIVNEITLVGSRCGRFERAIPLLASGKVKVDEMISERMKLAEAPKAFEHAARKGVLKVLLGFACLLAAFGQTPHPPVTQVELKLDSSHPRLISLRPCPWWSWSTPEPLPSAYVSARRSRYLPGVIVRCARRGSTENAREPCYCWMPALIRRGAPAAAR